MTNESRVAQLENYQSQSIEWRQLWSLAALYASIVVGWIAYHNYQPKLLDKFEFNDFAFPLAIAQGIILVITPLIAGRLGDRFRFQRGHRLPIISSGIAFAAMIFMAVAFTLLANPGEVFRWVLPVLIVLWLIAMSTFTSPALSTLELFTPVEKLPRAMAILTIVGNLVYSLEPVIVDIIDRLGAPLTFVAGGAVVFISGYALRKNSLGLFQQQSGRPQAAFRLDTQRSRYGMIFLLGIAVGLATTILFQFFPDKMEQTFSASGIEGKWWVAGVLLLSALFSIPASEITNRLGSNRAFWMSMAATSLAIVGVLVAPGVWAVGFFAFVFAFAFTVLNISALPLAIRSANYYEKVFCVGIFFGGIEFPEGIIESVLARLG